MKIIPHPLTAAFACLAVALPAKGQTDRLWQNVTYEAEISATVSDGNFAPFWLTSNKYGLSSVKNNSGYLRGGVFRRTEADSLRHWRIGYGADMAIPVEFTSKFIVQQFYVDVQYKRVRLSLGQKEQPMELRNAALSSGAMTSGINARPIPQARIELPDYWVIPGTRGWVAVKGHVAYGMFTDDKWQTDMVLPTERYTKHALFHSKAGYLRLGNTDKFPVTLTGGFEMGVQFGGEAWNVTRRPDDLSDFDAGYVNMGHSLSDFWNAFIPGGEDAADGDYANVEGNHLGSWHLSAKYHGKGWSLRAYAEHFFEDHSQLFFQYGWKDMLYGVEAEFPKNPFVSTFVYEHIGTKDQTGGLYHDATSILPDQISGADNYYNHGTFTGWQHWGQALGNPLLVSPIYNSNGIIYFYHNRITAHHFGLSGQPLAELAYRALFTHTKSYGTYDTPLPDPAYGNYFMLELNYQPRRLQGWSFVGAVATNGGSLLGRSTGGMLTIRKTGRIGGKKQARMAQY